MPDIIIKSEPGITIKKDTTEYLAKNFKTNETRKVEDLLKNINGFSITPDGKISYNGKIISALLINGDDLVQDQYTLLSKNLSADIVDKIQVIENYNKNRLVGSISKSGEIAINLKLDKKINGKLSRCGFTKLF